jgi:hypothetical protein
MKQELKDKWVAALRSGKYKQTRQGKLKNRGGAYCCLGVLCEVMEVPSKFDNFYSEYEYDGNTLSLSEKIRKQAGIRQKDANKLVEMNDDTKATFKDIADYIEKRKSI